MADSTDSELGPETAPADDSTPPRRSQRTALTVIGLIGALVIGFAVGFLVRPSAEDDTAVPEAGSVDVGFAQDMSEHHSQAVEMSAIALADVNDPAVRSLAYDILTTQQNQLGQMQAWLDLWGQPLLPSGGYMGWMQPQQSDGHGQDSDEAMHMGPMAKMPGMATSEDMTALRQATGPAADVLFLQLMLRHHEGGLPMMEYAAEHAAERVTRDLAQKMVDTQESESTLITNMLAERGSSPLPMN
ncbi:DUF305 domain-containing protein [Rhodococcus sp. WMMA185]|uniref:DUF305 domain-containing protein n=1 Tax=Rhodococcus sp. WMMA185 TaxID=679318 RepID=UPI000878C96D|nr:DUF305 domain-containing protein [Rhodococcus sp. WMMA185]AOW93036.1 DUF305 domain-containing protein [Rhodococcus sp. WMMA185]